MFGKGSKYEYKDKEGNLVKCEFLTSTFEDGYPYSVGLINHFKKEVSPCHGYQYPNRCANGLMRLAVKLGYDYVDSEMPSEKNKTLLKKIYKTGKKEDIFLGQVKEIYSPSVGGLERYEIVDIIWQKQGYTDTATWYLTKVAMRKIN
jgi:hypothetical protein